jgi:hypothetical protein
MKWIHYYHTTLGKRDSEGMIPRRLSNIIVANSNSHGNTCQSFGRKKKYTVGHGPMMKSFSDIKENPWEGFDEEKACEEACERKKKNKETTKSFATTTSMHFGSVEEEETKTYKKRRKKERVQKNKEDAT